jgi:hypothetical protein
MLAIGGIGPYLLMWAFVAGIVVVCGRVCFGKDRNESIVAVCGNGGVLRALLFVGLYPTAWLLGAGYVCVSSGGESGMCGVDGYDGGVAMLAIGGLMAMGMAYMRARPPSEQIVDNMLVEIAGVGVPFFSEERARQERERALAAARASAQLVVEGQEEGEPQHAKMGRYELMEGKIVNGRGVWQRKEGKEGQKDGYLYYARPNQVWVIHSDKASMEAGKAAGWVSSAAGATARSPDKARAGKWKVNDGKGTWPKAPKVGARAVEAEEWAAMAAREEESAKQEREARTSAQLVVEGQEEGEPQHDKMGRYELMEGKIVNGRGVWQRKEGKEGQKDWYLYYARDQRWLIDDKENMEAGKGVGWVHSAAAATARSPDKAPAGKWGVWDGKSWPKAPKVGARAVEAEEWAAMAPREEESAKQERERALAAARASAQLVVEGQEEGERQHSKMGRYELMEGKIVNGRGVWQRKEGKEGQKEQYLFYGSDQRWFISHKEEMEAGKSSGWVSVAGATAWSPDKAAAGEWEVSDGTGTWPKAPKVGARAVEAEEWAAMAAREEGRQR